MALQWAGSLWQQVAGSGVVRRPVTAVPSVRDAKESGTRHNPITSYLRGSIWRRSGSLWRSLISQSSCHGNLHHPGLHPTSSPALSYMTSGLMPHPLRTYPDGKLVQYPPST